VNEVIGGLGIKRMKLVVLKKGGGEKLLNLLWCGGD